MTDIADLFIKAMDDHTLVTVPPGDYPLSAPLEFQLNDHQTRPWGIWGPGARLIAEYDDPSPMVLFEAYGSAQLRFLSIELGLKGKANKQPGIKLLSKAPGAAIYRFNLNRMAIENCDDAIILEGNVFEGDITTPWCSDNNCALALGNPEEGGIISAINVWGGSFAQQKKDAVRTYADVRYREPYDFSMFGTYVGNTGRYSIMATAGAHLLKGVRVENPWTNPATHDPDNTVERACIKLANYGTLEQVVGGGNGNGTCLVDGYLSGNPLILRECTMYSDRGLKVKLAKLDGNEGKAVCHAYNCRQRVEYTDKVKVTYQ